MASKVLLLTMGDPAGVGPELCLKALLGFEFPSGVSPVIVGDVGVLREVNLRFGYGLDIHEIKSPKDVVGEGRRCCVLSSSSIDWQSLSFGEPSAAGGSAALAAIDMATDLCLAEEAIGMVTGPVSKEAIELGGVKFSGHTGHISKRCGDFDEMMMMSAPDKKLHIAYVTTHIAIADLPNALSEDLIVRRILECWRFAKSLGLSSVAVCGLNPHCGENGMMGSEELDVISPAVAKACDLGVDCRGPYPADTLFVEQQRLQHDVILAMYHDQGGIPFKMLAFDDGVNHTLGLPIVRTSVDHGTAWPIAWQGKVRDGSMRAAMDLAIQRGLDRLERFGSSSQC